MTGVLISEDTGRPRKEGQVESEAEIGMMLPQAKECLRPPEAGRGEEGSFPRASGGAAPPLLHFRLLASRAVREDISGEATWVTALGYCRPRTQVHRVLGSRPGCGPGHLVLAFAGTILLVSTRFPTAVGLYEGQDGPRLILGELCRQLWARLLQELLPLILEEERPVPSRAESCPKPCEMREPRRMSYKTPASRMKHFT